MTRHLLAGLILAVSCLMVMASPGGIVAAEAKDNGGEKPNYWYPTEVGTRIEVMGGGLVDTGKEKKTFETMGGLKFEPSPLKVFGVLMRRSYTITITGYDSEKGMLVPTKLSPIPIESPTVQGKELVRGKRAYTHAVGITWEFSKPGIAFPADGAKYVSEKAGATIRFTPSGVEMDGIKKVAGSSQ